MIICSLGDVECELKIIDHYGSEENCYERLRAYYLAQSDVCLICFSVESPESFEEVRTKWLGEVQRACPDTEIVLVGTQIDMRDENAECLTKEDGEGLAKEIGAKTYIECTSNNPKELKKILDEVGCSCVELDVGSVLMDFRLSLAYCRILLDENRKLISERPGIASSGRLLWNSGISMARERTRNRSSCK